MSRCLGLVFCLILILPLQAREHWVYSETHPYICGYRFKKLCRTLLDEYGLRLNPQGQTGYYYVKTEHVPLFFSQFLPEENFVLITHNDDRGIDESYLPFLETENLVSWYALNIKMEHPKLHALPIGICNFAKFDSFEEVVKSKTAKSKMVYANYKIANNVAERTRCRELTGVPLAKNKPFKEYLKDIAKSYFVLSPEGNGIDCYRTWEALYLKAIPIVTKSTHMERFKGMPILIIDSWEDYKNLKLSKELYERLWQEFDMTKVPLDSFIDEN
ncbi:MAG: hypothetical protein KDK48_00865 [Chlamydiia bacterium]|nr:hypothetical protein [Chlamydiia bacterium]